MPTIKALRAKAEAIRAAEFEKALSRLGEGMSKKQMKAIEELSKGIVNKLLHGPMTALRWVEATAEGSYCYSCRQCTCWEVVGIAAFRCHLKDTKNKDSSLLMLLRI